MLLTTKIRIFYETLETERIKKPRNMSRQIATETIRYKAKYPLRFFKGPKGKALYILKEQMTMEQTISNPEYQDSDKSDRGQIRIPKSRIDDVM